MGILTKIVSETALETGTNSETGMTRLQESKRKVQSFLRINFWRSFFLASKIYPYLCVKRKTALPFTNSYY